MDILYYIQSLTYISGCRVLVGSGQDGVIGQGQLFLLSD